MFIRAPTQPAHIPPRLLPTQLRAVAAAEVAIMAAAAAAAVESIVPLAAAAAGAVTVPRVSLALSTAVRLWETTGQ